MKAIVRTAYGSPDVLQLKYVAKPIPKDNEVLIRVRAAAVNSTDPIIRKGEPFVARLSSGLTRPKHSIPGTALAGEIEAVGKDVRRFGKGDQVYGGTGITLGAHAEYKCVPEEGVLAAKPANMTFEQAAAVVDGALTALHFLRNRGNTRSGQNVLINGASGSVGTAAVQLAKYYGAVVTGVCSTANVEMVRSLGADTVVDYRKEDFTKNAGTYDIIFDAVAKSSFSRCKSSLKQGGVYLTTIPTLAILLQMLWTSMVGSKKAIFAATSLSWSSEDLVFLKELIEAGKLRAIIDRVYPLGQIAEAHRYVETGHKKGNVVVTVAHKS